MDFMDSIPSVLFSAEFTRDNTLAFTYCNQSVERFFGVTAAEVTQNAERLLQCFREVHRQAFMAGITRAIQENSSSECECELTLGSQASRWLLVQIAPHNTPTGMAASGVISDMSAAHTERVSAVNNAKFFLRLQDSLPDTFYYKDVNSVFLGGNKAWYTHHGYDSLSAIVGKSDADSKTLSPELKREILAQEQEMMRTGIPIHKTEHYVSQNGNEFFRDSKKTPLYDEHNNIIGLVGITRDVTEQVKTAKALEKAREESNVQKITVNVMEAALRESTALLDALNMHAIVSVANNAGTIIEVNDAFCKISGYSREELLGKNHRIVNSNVQSRQFWVDMWADIASGKPWRNTVCNRAKNGTHYWVDTFIAPFMNSDGKIEKYISIRTDITEAKQQETRLQLALEQLEKSAQVANEANRAKSEFLANMSHELRTPMNAILGMLTLLKKTELNSRQIDYAQKTEGAARSLLGLLNDILDLSKAEAGKMLLDPQPFSLDTVLRDLSVILSTNVGKKPVEVLFDIAADVQSELVGDAMRLQQVLLNLGSNAIKFTEQGSIILKIEALQKSATAITLKFSVRDTGIGIAPENQTRIFSGFTQAEASTTRRFGGTGLGVAISQRLVNLMGGQLELTSTLGEGSCFFFTISLPLSVTHIDHNQTALHHNNRANDSPNNNTNNNSNNNARSSVLVVDDNPIALNIIAQLCESVGWQTHRASSGEQALSLIKKQAEHGNIYEAVFVDWQMPGMDGWQTSLAIHNMDITHSAPVIVMVTAHDREMLALRSETEQALIDGFLVKPITASMLVDAVTGACGHTQTSHGLQHHATEATTEPRLQGMKILLTEDNLNNQQVARELLEAEGAIVDVANNGQEAVDRVAQLPAFDVVLMDLQMPVMDGFTATKRIRTDLGLTDLPIVAMTANAMQSDKEACMQAGMNDHIGKPFDLNNLIHVLRLRAGWEITQAAPVAVTTNTAPYLAAAMAAKVDIKNALARLGGKQELYVRMLPMFLANLNELPQKLSAYVETEQYLKASQQLHSLKGLAGTMGAMELATQAGLAEKILAGDVTAAAARLQVFHINALISDMLPLLGDLLSALQPPVIEPDVIAKQAVDRAQSVDELALLQALEKLHHQLKNFDMAASHTAVQLQKDFGVTLNESALGKYVKPLTVAMDNLDFEKAADCVFAMQAYIHRDKDAHHD